MLSLQCSSSVRIQKKPHPELNALLISFHFICIRSLQTKSFGALCVNEETELRHGQYLSRGGCHDSWQRAGAGLTTTHLTPLCPSTRLDFIDSECNSAKSCPRGWRLTQYLGRGHVYTHTHTHTCRHACLHACKTYSNGSSATSCSSSLPFFLQVSEGDRRQTGRRKRC